jgi:two-component system, chemotaxis family, protein-glutamate methylesterase/glutaminase
MGRQTAAERKMANRDILALGASAGGVEALIVVARGLDRNFPAAVLVTIHLPSHFRSSLDDILTRAGPLHAEFAVEGALLAKKCIYIAPPDRHLLLEGDRITLGVGPRENNSRPAIDAMLRSVAVCCGHRAVGAVLTGTLGDGASGLWALRQCGGLAVVQDPKDAAFAEMPLNALNRADPDYVVRLSDMAGLFDSLAQEPAGQQVPVPRSIRYEVEVARSGRGSMEEMDRLGRRSVLACPDCGGVMWELEEGELVRLRCHVGHSYTAELMSLALDENLRRALGSAQRALEERVALAHKLRRQAVKAGHERLAEHWADKAKEYEREMAVIRKSIERMEDFAAEVERAAKTAAE